MDRVLQATFYRSALLLGLAGDDDVRRWADEVIAREPSPPRALIDVAAVPPGDLSAMRHALWPMVVDPEPPAVLTAILVVLHGDLVSNRRALGDTVTILRQMRSFLRLPPSIYAGLNSALVDHDAAQPTDAIERWLRQAAAEATWRPARR